MIDKNRIFQLFGSPDDGKNNAIKELVNADKDFLKSPEAKLGMFTKMIYNHDVFHQKLKKFFTKEKAPFNANEAKEASSFAVFNRAYSYIKVIDLDNPNHQDALWEFNPEPLLKALNQAIMYFESTEEYERCAFLVKIKEMKKALEKDVPL
tara:strand:- start:110 stop:562 length:453 start_codon:yes stop_codon:yes gene_type:complete